MKIIKEEKIVEKEIKKVCSNCKTKFSYTLRDTKSDRDGS